MHSPRVLAYPGVVHHDRARDRGQAASRTRCDVASSLFQSCASLWVPGNLSNLFFSLYANPERAEDSEQTFRRRSLDCQNSIDNVRGELAC